jgi:hypothetical protein
LWRLNQFRGRRLKVFFIGRKEKAKRRNRVLMKNRVVGANFYL